MRAAQALHAALTILAAIGFFRVWARTRFWLPRYVHWMALVALGLGLAFLRLVPPDAPIYRGGWTGVKQAAIALLFPAIVYAAFIFYGGQHAAVEARRRAGRVRCPHCGGSVGSPGEPCASCGQAIQ